MLHQAVSSSIPHFFPSHTHAHTHTHTHTHTQTYTHTHSCYKPSLSSMLMKYLFLFHFETRKELVFKAFYLWQSVHFICSVVSNCVQPHGLQHTRTPCPSPIPRACWISPPWNSRCHPTISSSLIPFFLAFIPSKHQELFQWDSSLHQVGKVLELQLQRQFF